jgi:hypothetical protein
MEKLLLELKMCLNAEVGNTTLHYQKTMGNNAGYDMIESWDGRSFVTNMVTRRIVGMNDIGEIGETRAFKTNEIVYMKWGISQCRGPFKVINIGYVRVTTVELPSHFVYNLIPLHVSGLKMERRWVGESLLHRLKLVRHEYTPSSGIGKMDGEVKLRGDGGMEPYKYKIKIWSEDEKHDHDHMDMEQAQWNTDGVFRNLASGICKYTYIHTTTINHIN